MSFIEELKRRNVFKVGIAYGITAWVIAQVAGLAADSFLAPDWVMKMLISILILGFPVALVMAWAYEMTPQGLRRETDVVKEQPTSRASGKINRSIIVALIVTLAYIAYDKLVLDPILEETSVETISPQSAEVKPVEETSVLDERSIAVLSFFNMSDDDSNQYFAEGLSEELLNLLAKIPELRVAARTSSFSFKGKDVKIAQIGTELNVNYVLEGSVRKAGNHVRITAQLIKTDDGFYLWSETFDRNLDDIFVVQDEIANAVVSALKVTLVGAVPEPRKTDPEVYSLYLQGMYFNNLRGKEDLEKSLVAYKQALAIDPDYAPAWIGISIAYQDQARNNWLSREQAYELSLAAVESALAIDREMASAWASLAYLKRGRGDWAGAKTAIDQAINLEPNNGLVIGSAATLAGTFGQLETSIELFERNVRRDPLSLSSLRALGSRYATIGRFEESLETYNRLIAINPDFPGIHINIAAVFLWKGKAETALIEIEKDPTSRYYPYMKARILSTLGNEQEAQAVIGGILEEPDQVIPASIAATYAWRGENDLAFEWFEKAFDQDSGSLSFFLRNRWNKKLEGDPRDPIFVKKLGLLEEWKAIPKPDKEVQP
jgi:adenylate cyclase